MSADGDVIDLEPIYVQSIVDRGEYVAVVCSKQPCYSRAVGENPRVVPLYRCEIRIWNGNIELAANEVPFETDDWKITFDGGSRRCFLPVSFAVNGPIVLTLGVPEEPIAVITGRAASVELGDQDGVSQEYPASFDS